MKHISVFVLDLLFLTALFVISGCQAEPKEPDLKSVAIAVNFDPTTEIDSNVQISEKKTLDLSAEDKQKIFRDEAKFATLQRVVAKLQPSDMFYLTSVTKNSLQTSVPLSFELPTARNNKESRRFLSARESELKRVGDWFEIIGNNPPCPNSTIYCSDVFSSVTASARFLQKSNGSRKVLFVLSDMQDNITRAKCFPPDTFRDTHVVILYAFPTSQSPKDYEPFRQCLLEIFKTGNPRSVRILFPTEARAFNFEDFMTEVRRDNTDD